MTFDDAGWHYANDDHHHAVGRKAAASRGGFFIAWAAFAGLLSRDFKADFDAEIDALTERLLTPGAFALCCCDGQLVDEDLNAQGIAFARTYLYPEHSPYLADLQTCLASEPHTPFAVADTWANFDMLRPRLDERLQQWLASR